MFLTEVADFFQDFTIPYTASRIVRITQNIEFHPLAPQCLFPADQNQFGKDHPFQLMNFRSIFDD